MAHKGIHSSPDLASGQLGQLSGGLGKDTASPSVDASRPYMPSITHDPATWSGNPVATVHRRSLLSAA